MRKIFAALVILIFAGIAVFYWYKNNGQIGQTQKPEERILTISGSSSGLNLMRPVISAFEQKYPGTRIKILSGTETSDGIRGVGEGVLDVGSVARPLKKEEAEKYPGIEVLIYAKDAMVLAVNSSVTVNNLSKDQVRKIQAGQIIDWSQAGGQNGEIVVLDREESESSKAVLRKYILGSDLKITKNAIMMHSGDAMNKGIREIQGAIGQTSLGVIRMQNIKAKPLAIDGIIPNSSSISSGKYEMVREYGIVVPKGELKGVKKDFVDFLFSTEASGILAANEIVPVPR